MLYASSFVYCVFFFFFQAEDGIRDWSVTGVQTCALPIYQEVRKVVVVPEVAHDADGFWDAADDLVIGEGPFTPDYQYGRPRADLKTTDAKGARGEERFFDGAPGAGIGLATVYVVRSSAARTGAKAGGQDPGGRKLLPIEVDSHRCLGRQIGVNQGVLPIDFEILRHQRAVELRRMAERSSPVLYHVVGENHLAIGRMPDRLLPGRAGVGHGRLAGECAEVDHAAKGFAGPLRGHFHSVQSFRAALELESDVQDCAGGCDSRIESVGQDPACGVRGEATLGEACRGRGGEPHGEDRAPN